MKHTLSSPQRAVRFPPLKFARQLRDQRTATLQTPLCHAPLPHAPPNPHSRCPAQPRACLAEGRKRRTRGGWESPARRVIPVSPARLCCNPFLPVRRKRPAPIPRQRLARGRERQACPRLFPESSRCAGRRREASRNFPTSLSLVSRAAPRDPSSPPSPATDPAADARRPAAAPGQMEFTCQESFQLPTRFPPRGPCFRERRAGRSTATAAPAAPEPSSRSCHRGGSSRARPPALLGPHRDLIGSASPRPCACSGRHLPCARPLGLRLPLPSRLELPGLCDPLGRGTRTFRPAPPLLLSQHVPCGRPSFP